MGCDYYEFRLLRITHARGVAYHPKELARERVYNSMISAPCSYCPIIDRYDDTPGLFCCFCGQSELQELEDEQLEDDAERLARAKRRKRDHCDSFVGPKSRDEGKTALLYADGAYLNEAFRKKYGPMVDEVVARTDAQLRVSWDGDARVARNATRESLPEDTGAGPLESHADIARVESVPYRVWR